MGEGLAQDDKAALRVADQKEWQIGLSLADQPAGSHQVNQELVKLAHMHPEAGALPVTPVIVGPAVEARVGEVVEYVEVAARVFGETVNEEQHRSGISFSTVSAPEEAVAVRAFNPTILDLNHHASRRSARTRSTALRHPR